MEKTYREAIELCRQNTGRLRPRPTWSFSFNSAFFFNIKIFFFLPHDTLFDSVRFGEWPSQLSRKSES